MPSNATQLIRSAQALCVALGDLQFGAPVTHVYNPLEYAREPHEQFLRRFSNGEKRVVLLGMNPGPFGMAQTGIPFGEVAAVRDWMGITAPVGRPANENPKRPIEGFSCSRSEVSGRRLWGLAAGRFGTATAFFENHFVLNYCPLVWMEAGGRNITPDKLPVAEMAAVNAACDRHLREALDLLKPEWAIGVGAFAEKRLLAVSGALRSRPRIERILHPSPASPKANRGWAEQVTRQLQALGIW